MAREIKFRFWDEEFKTMRYNAVVGFNPDQKLEIGLHGGSSANGFEVFCGRWTSEQTFQYMPVMQFTGLKDKNGVDIYEGDIIATKFYPHYVERIHWRGKPDAICEVYWDLAGFGLKAQGEEDYRYPDMCEINYNETEVIGNIYQNEDMFTWVKKLSYEKKPS